jgi:ribosomal protein RSM22 (predicted rRNA methylase)
MAVATALPPELAARLDAGLNGVSGRDLARRADALSRAYRDGQGSAAAIRSREDALAYAVARLPATYASAVRVLGELYELAPDLAIASHLDIGAGPGTMQFAVGTVFGGRPETHAVEPNPHFVTFARELGATASRVGTAWPKTDLATLGYVLAELNDAERATMMRRVFDAATEAIVVIEPGTPTGYAAILDARARLIAAGWHILAPCPHQSPCPLADRVTDWCHFTVRLPRRRAHLLAKHADVPFEDEPFSYVIAVSRGFPGARWGRLLTRPAVNKSEVGLTVCAPDGLTTVKVPRRDKAGYKAARKLAWGDRYAPAANEDAT